MENVSASRTAFATALTLSLVDRTTGHTWSFTTLHATVFRTLLLISLLLARSTSSRQTNFCIRGQVGEGLLIRFWYAVVSRLNLLLLLLLLVLRHMHHRW